MGRDIRDSIMEDDAVFSRHILQNIILDSWKKKVWACWKVLTGEAGIVLVRINPEKFKP